MLRLTILFALLLSATEAIASNHCARRSQPSCEATYGCEWVARTCVAYDPVGRKQVRDFFGGVQTVFAWAFALFGLFGLAVVAYFLRGLYREGRPAQKRAASSYGLAALVLLALAWFAGNVLQSTPMFWVAMGGLVVLFFSWLLYDPAPEVKRLPSEEHHLRAAYNYIKPIWELKETDSHRIHGQVADLTTAAQHIMNARESNPRAQLVVKEKERVHTYTVDDLAYMALYMEADLFHALAKAGNRHAFIHTEYHRAEGRKALEAITKALRYRPTNAACLTLQGQILVNLGRRDEALEAVNEALQNNPDYMPAHRLRDALS